MDKIKPEDIAGTGPLPNEITVKRIVSDNITPPRITPAYEFGADWMETMPRRVRVAHLVFDVEIMAPGYERERQNFGECNHNDQVIRLCPNMKAQKARYTLLHELIHALWVQYDVSRDDEGSTEEAAATMLPTALLSFKRDNPEAWAWIFEGEG